MISGRLFAENLNRLMMQRGMTQVELAQCMRVSQPAVSKWLHGTLPDIGHLFGLADLFEVDARGMVEGIVGSVIEADQIKTRRQAIGMTLEQLAEATGYAIGTISGVENGHDRPSRRLMAAVNKVLQCSPKTKRAS